MEDKLYTRDYALDILNLFERIADRYGFDVSAMMEGDCYSDLLDETEGIVNDVAWCSRVGKPIVEGKFSGTK